MLPISSAKATPATIVTTGEDQGPGSLRAALTSGNSFIVISDEVAEIQVESRLDYTKADDLRIVGSGQTVLAKDDHTLLLVKKGANVWISNLDFLVVDENEFSASWPGTGKGIFLQVPAESKETKVVTLRLQGVGIYGVASHGVHVSDCSLGDACGSGGGGGGTGSQASIHVQLRNVVIEDVGHGKFDADGLRVDERGTGDILLEAVDSSFIHVGADGVELDEGGEGDVIVEVRNSSFVDNGGYCDEPGAIPGDPGCFEDGGLDLDDGFDIDEAADGSIFVTIVNVALEWNFDEGFDVDEEGPGDIIAALRELHSAENGNEGVKCSEADEGNVDLEIRSSSLFGNGDGGALLESMGPGQIQVEVHETFTKGNLMAGLGVSQDDDVEFGTLELLDSVVQEGVELINVEML